MFLYMNICKKRFFQKYNEIFLVYLNLTNLYFNILNKCKLSYYDKLVHSNYKVFPQ